MRRGMPCRTFRGCPGCEPARCVWGGARSRFKRVQFNQWRSINGDRILIPLVGSSELARAEGGVVETPGAEFEPMDALVGERPHCGRRSPRDRPARGQAGAHSLPTVHEAGSVHYAEAPLFPFIQVPRARDSRGARNRAQFQVSSKSMNPGFLVKYYSTAQNPGLRALGCRRPRRGVLSTKPGQLRCSRSTKMHKT